MINRRMFENNRILKRGVSINIDKILNELLK